MRKNDMYEQARHGLAMDLEFVISKAKEETSRKLRATCEEERARADAAGLEVVEGMDRIFARWDALITLLLE